MRKVISPLFIAILIGFIGYDHQEEIIDHTKYLINDPAQKVLNANLPETDTVETFISEVYGTITLLAGTEDSRGFRHILARHTKDYFINFKDKNEDTLFPDSTTGKEILLGIKHFCEHCVDVSAYNRQTDRNVAYVGFTEIGKERIKCLLIVRREDRTLTTFYPFIEIPVIDIDEEEEEEPDDDYYYD